jgi:hypothetical protein
LSDYLRDWTSNHVACVKWLGQKRDKARVRHKIKPMRVMRGDSNNRPRRYFKLLDLLDLADDLSFTGLFFLTS